MSEDIDYDVQDEVDPDVNEPDESDEPDVNDDSEPADDNDPF